MAEHKMFCLAGNNAQNEQYGRTSQSGLHQKKTAGPDSTKKICPKYVGVIQCVLTGVLPTMSAYIPCLPEFPSMLGPLFVKQAVALALLVLIPMTIQFGYLNSGYQLPNFIRSYHEPVCNVFTQQEMQEYFHLNYDQLV